MLRYFMYCRKSSEAEDRQVLSIKSQKNELKSLAERLNLQVIQVLSGFQSAKSPNRPVFTEMIKQINQGKANGLICWRLDRLARNPIDGGQIIWMLQKGIIGHIQTHERGYYPEDNVLLMSVEFGMANQFVLDLSKNVKRGLKTKAEKGWLPTTPPLGYLNDRTKERGNRDIIKDPERFELVKKMWQMMLSGGYTPPRIANIANNEWGFKTPYGRSLPRSSIYEIFTNPFYYGWFEYPKGSGNWYKGNHEPMISVEEYDRVQMLLGRDGKPRLKSRNFAFTGLIRCGECGAMITAEEKKHVVCSKCRHKFSSNNRFECPKCKTSIEEMNMPTIRQYTYYHCTKRRNPDCTQGSVESKKLEEQIERYLSKIHISEGFKNWAIKYLRVKNEREMSSKENILSSQRKAYDSCLKKLNNLFQLKISPQNTDGSLLLDEEYARQKAELMREKARLEEALNDNNSQFEKWLDTGEKIFNFACHARYWFRNGISQEKANILQALGSNLTLKDKNLQIELKKPFRAIGQMVEKVPQVRPMFEPGESSLNERKSKEKYFKRPIVQREIDEVRTWIMKNLDGLLPSLSGQNKD